MVSWTSDDVDPVKDLERAIKMEFPMHREAIMNVFDPDRKVWSEERRKVIMEE